MKIQFFVNVIILGYNADAARAEAVLLPFRLKPVSVPGCSSFSMDLLGAYYVLLITTSSGIIVLKDTRIYLVILYKKVMELYERFLQAEKEKNF